MLQDVKNILASSLRQVEGIELVPLSGLQGEGTDALMEACFSVYDRWRRRISTPQLNRFIHALQAAPERCPNGFKISFLTQVRARPPTFAVFAPARGLPDNMKKFLVRALRQEFDLPGVPIRLYIRDKGQGRQERLRGNGSGRHSQPPKGTTPFSQQKQHGNSPAKNPLTTNATRHRMARKRRRVGKALFKK